MKFKVLTTNILKVTSNIYFDININFACGQTYVNLIANK